MIPILEDGPADARVHLLLAHGAGTPMDSPFMEACATGLAAAGVRVTRFEFPYMAARRETGTKRPPDREAVLLDTWRRVVRDSDRPVAIGGKSMGGRMASMVADEVGAAALVCLGYPFHAPGRPGAPRVQHLLGLRTPALIVQGTRDPFGRPGEVAGYGLPVGIRVHWLEDGDHDLRPRKASGRTVSQNWEEAIAAVASFLAGAGGGA